MGRCSEDGKRKFVYLIIIMLIIGSIISYFYEYIIDGLIKGLAGYNINNIISMAMAATAISVAIASTNGFKRIALDIVLSFRDIADYMKCVASSRAATSGEIVRSLKYIDVVDSNIRYENNVRKR